MARISTLTTGTPASTSALLGNVGANTRSFDVEELLGVPITATGDLLVGDSSNNTTRLPAGSSKQILGLTTGIPSWNTPAVGGSTALSLMAREAHLPSGSTDNLPASIQMHVSSGGTIIKPRWVEGVFTTINVEHLQWNFMCPANYASAPVVDVYFKPVSAIGAGTSVAEFGAYLAAVTPTDADMDIKEFDTVNWANSSVTSSGLLQSVSITMTNDDSIAAGDMCILDVCRNGPGTTDTKAGSLEVPMVRFRYTAV